MDGATTQFGEDALQASAAAYKPELHEAPLTIGHPKDNLPAYGWVSSLAFHEGALEASPVQVEPQFAEMVNAGRFKKISASFYTPDSPSNPAPGVYYLRHVAFLGAQPPAVKGMRDASFADDEKGVVVFEETAEFGEGWMARVVGRLFKGLREHMIDKQDLDTADRVLPSYLIEDLDEMSRQADTESAALPAFSETDTGGTNAMTDAEKKAELDQREADLKAREDKIAEQEAKFAEQERAHAEKQYADFADKVIGENKATPAERGTIIATQRALAATTDQVEFGEGDKAEKVAAIEAYRRSFDQRKSAVDFQERSGQDQGGGEGVGDMTAEELAEKASEYREAKRQAGTIVSVTQAVAAVRAGKAA